MCNTKLCASSVAKTKGAPSAGKQKRRLARTKYLGRIHRAKRWNRCGMDRRESDHQHGFRIAKRWRIVQAEIQFVFRRQSQGRNVLILRGVRRAQNAGDVHRCANVGAVISAAGVGCGADLRQQVALCARSQGCHHRLAVGIVEHELIRVLSQARHLLSARLVEALLIHADIQTTRQQRRTRFELLGVGRRNLADEVEIFFETLAIEGCLL